MITLAFNLGGGREQKDMSIIIVGAGPNLGAAVARRFGGEVGFRLFGEPSGRHAPEEARSGRRREGASSGSAVLQALREGGADPAHGGDAARRRERKNAAHQKALARWTRGTPTRRIRNSFRRKSSLD
jgi:hypothetical protein